MDNCLKFTTSQIRYMIWLSKLSEGGVGVKNIELATALSVSKPSAHNMLKSLSELGIITHETFGLANLTEFGRRICKKYEVCFYIMQEKMREICGGGTTEIAICGVLADLPSAKIDELYLSGKNQSTI